jgi:UTP--glucose-1-phosphate uridylyltransferase
MKLRPSVAGYAFDPSVFAALRSRLRHGHLSPAAARLSEPPLPLLTLPNVPLLDLRTMHRATPGSSAQEFARLAERGRTALRNGRVAVLILNGGMATRFGGEPKGVVPLVEGERETFLWAKLRQVVRLAGFNMAEIPVVIMHSFATAAASEQYLDEIDWAGLPKHLRHSFTQSVMPRVTPSGVPLHELPGGDHLPDHVVYCAPGHGDTLARLRDSGILRKLREDGIEHLLVSNVDNLGAELEPLLIGAHVDAIDAGAHMSVEVVRREGDKGGCVALVGNRPVIVEGFRLPPGTDLDHYPQFNTNTLWFWLSAIDREFDLDWFPVEREVPGHGDAPIPAVQFEQLIGQATEHLDAHYFEVDRERRFIPIKTREDLKQEAPRMRALIKRLR